MSLNLHAIIRRGNISEFDEFVNTLTDVRKEFNEVTSDGWNAVRVAVAFDRPLILQRLFDKGAHEAPPRAKDGWTSLHIACFHGYDSCLEILLEAGVQSSIAELDDQGRWPIHCAVQRDHILCLEHLLNHRSEQNVVTAVTGNTALHVAAIYGAVKCMQRLLGTQRAKLALQMVNKQHRSVLAEAVMSDSIGAPMCLSLLLDFLLTSPTSPLAPSTSAALPLPLIDAFLLAISSAKSKQMQSFLAFEQFFEFLGSYSVLMTSGLEWVPNSQNVTSPLYRRVSVQYSSPESARNTLQTASIVGCPMHLAIGTWSSSFVAALIDAIFSAVPDSVTQSLRREKLRNLLLVPRSGGEQSSGGEPNPVLAPLSVAPLSLVFSSSNKSYVSMLSELFGARGEENSKGCLLRHSIVDASMDLLVDVEEKYSLSFAAITGDVCLNISLKARSATHVLNAALEVARKGGNGLTTVVSERRAAQIAIFFKRLSVTLLDTPALLPGQIFPCSSSKSLWSSECSDNCLAPEAAEAASRVTYRMISLGRSAAETGLLRSYFEARVAQAKKVVADFHAKLVAE